MRGLQRRPYNEADETMLVTLRRSTATDAIRIDGVGSVSAAASRAAAGTADQQQ